MKIVFASHTNFNPTLVVGSHHLARNLAKRGHQVLHLSSPLTLLHLAQLQNRRYRERWKVWLEGGVRIQEDLIDYVPLSLFPWQLARRFVVGPANLFLKCVPSIRALVRRLGFEAPDLLLVDEPRMAGIETICAPARMFFRSTDLNADFKKDARILQAERWLIGRARGLIGTSAPVLASLCAMSPNKPALLLENGVDRDFFSRPAPEPDELKSMPAPRAIYVGAVDARFDFEAVEILARSHPELSVIIIGPVSISGVRPAKNIHVLGPKPYLTVPAYLQHCQVGLLPLTDHPANRGRSPMKLYEYAAAGLAVVASETEELARRKEAFVILYKNHDEIGVSVARALMDPQMRVQAQRAAVSRDWSSVTDQLISFTGSEC